MKSTSTTQQSPTFSWQALEGILIMVAAIFMVGVAYTLPSKFFQFCKFNIFSHFQTLSLVLVLTTTCLAANLPLDLPEGPPMTLRVRRDTPGYAPPGSFALINFIL